MEPLLNKLCGESQLGKTHIFLKSFRWKNLERGMDFGLGETEKREHDLSG